MLEFRNVSVSCQHMPILNDISLTFRDGEITTILGPNGCGKSTLFAAILGELSPEAGDIETPPQDRIAHVAQSFVAEPMPCID